jgi:competence protein ComEA
MKKVAMLFAALLAYSGFALAVVNINSASKEQLEKLDGIGPVKAQAIIDYRKKNGPFKKVEDIKNVDGIGDATFSTIRKDLVLSGTTTGPGKAAEKSDKAADKADKKAADAKATTKADAAKAEKKVDKAADKAEKKVDKAADKAEKKVDAAAKKADDKKADEKKADDKKK